VVECTCFESKRANGTVGSNPALPVINLGNLIMIYSTKILKDKWCLLKSLSDRCFLIHIILFKTILFCDLTLIPGLIIWLILFNLTALNEKFHLWFTDMHYKFLFSSKGSSITYQTYLFCLEARYFLEHRGSKLFVFASVFFIGATVCAGILDSSSIEYTKSTWVVLVVSLMLRTYFKTVLVPIFHPVRSSSNLLESGRLQIRYFHSSRSLHMPFGAAAKEFAKGISKFTFAYPKSTLAFGLVGFGIPMAQHMINKQTTFEFNDKTNAVAKWGKMKQSACAPGNTFNKDVCHDYTEIFNLTIEAVRKTF
jgi:hypothetical protein